MTSTPDPALCEFSEAPTEGQGRGASVANIAQRSPMSAAASPPLADFSDRVGREPSATNPAQPIEKSAAEPSNHTKICAAVLKRKQPSLRRRVARSLIIFCIGVAATLSWQSYGDATREMIASSYPQFGWLAPQSAFAETAPEKVTPTAPATPSDDATTSQEVKSILVNLAVLRQSVDQLAAQVVASRQQMAGDIAKLKAADQEVLDKISSAPPPRPAAPPARKPVPSPPQSSQEPPAR